jgi:hypothetical protein
MDSLGLALLGVVALAFLLQAVALVVIAREGLRAARRLDAFAERVGRELQPGVSDLERASQNFAELSDMAVVQARRLDTLVAETVEKDGARLRPAPGRDPALRRPARDGGRGVPGAPEGAPALPRLARLRPAGSRSVA